MDNDLTVMFCPCKTSLSWFFGSAKKPWVLMLGFADRGFVELCFGEKPVFWNQVLENLVLGNRDFADRDLTNRDFVESWF